MEDKLSKNLGRLSQALVEQLVLNGVNPVAAGQVFPFDDAKSLAQSLGTKLINQPKVMLVLYLLHQPADAVALHVLTKSDFNIGALIIFALDFRELLESKLLALLLGKPDNRFTPFPKNI